MAGLPASLDLLADLEVFLAERHVTRAAARLGITQSAASQRLAKLRAHFADPLLVPGRRGLVLTPRAEALAVPLARALAELRAALRAGEPFVPAQSARRFVLLGNDLFEAIGMPVLLRLLQAEAPGMSVQVERAGPDFVQRLEDGTADVAFVPDFVVPASLRRRSLPDQPFVVLVRERHPAARGRLDLRRYLSLAHLVIAPRGLPGSVVDDALEKLGEQRRVAARIQHFAAAPFLVVQTDLALTCPASLATLASGHFALRALAPPLELPLDRASMVWHERAHLDPGHGWLRARIAERFARLRTARRGETPAGGPRTTR
jgi:DNA-binding transcriptional LysR family regulator